MVSDFVGSKVVITKLEDQETRFYLSNVAYSINRLHLKLSREGLVSIGKYHHGQYPRVNSQEIAFGSPTSNSTGATGTRSLAFGAAGVVEAKLAVRVLRRRGASVEDATERDRVRFDDRCIISGTRITEGCCYGAMGGVQRVWMSRPRRGKEGKLEPCSAWRISGGA